MTKRKTGGCDTGIFGVGRIILGVFFLSSGVGKFVGEPGAMQEMLRPGFPLVVPLYWATATFETVVCGALLLGIATAWSSALLAALTIHDFWNDPGGSMERTSNLINFEKNFAIIGGLLVLVALGPGPYALRFGHAEQPPIRHSQESRDWHGRATR